MTTSVTNCLECGAEIPAEAKGLCPKCLLKLGLASQLGSTSLPASPANSGPVPIMPFEFGTYRIERLLGKGGMGAVYAAEDLASGRRVALKALGHSLDSPDTRKRFLREGRLAASINHPNTVYVYGTEEIEGAPVITMEIVEGGTLQERVIARGPLPVSEAVDAILQIIAGLEAAHAVGILHRDIKPSNCFIEENGMVKVGDFGLSISTTTRGDSALTLAGSVLGTPEFSSPEQLRGEDLNVRSDIYSVGMTLYFLLTGKTPFQAENVVQLLATVLDKPAPSPRLVRPEIPESLARVILRCLAKQAGDRFGTYDELRRALLPFTSTAPTPATLGLRFVAGCVDHAIFTITSMIAAPLLFGAAAMVDERLQRTPQWAWYTFALTVFEIAYFAVSEGRWGASPGKALVGLRVGGLDRNAPGIPRALLRALIYLVPTIVSMLRFLMPDAHRDSWIYAVLIAFWIYPALLAVTARRRNGFATVTDLLTKTRVIQRSAYEPRETVAQIEEPVAATDGMPKVGPYHVLSPLVTDDDGELLLGYDTKLMRRVWIRKAPAGATPVSAELRNAARPGRLRWLQGHRNDEVNWDAYEAVPGTPLLALLRKPQPWKNVRHWLSDLASEFAAATSDGTMPASLSLDRVWITASGSAKLLDFRAPGSEPLAESLPGTEAAAFLNQLAISALEGRVATADEARSGEPRVPIPIQAREFLRPLRTTNDFAALAGQLGVLLQERPAITRRRRLGLVAGCVVPSLVMAGIMIAGMTVFFAWEGKNPDVMRLKKALIRYEGMSRGDFPRDVDPATGMNSMEIYIAGRFGHVMNNPEAWSSQFIHNLLTKKERKSAEQIMAKHGQPSAEAMAAARATLGNTIDSYEKARSDPFKMRSIMWPMAFGGFIWAAFLSIACALLFRGGLLMRALGIAAVTRDGSDASRLRMFWRACAAWLWLPLGGMLAAMLFPVLPVNTVVCVVLSFVLAVAVWSAALRERSLQDRLAGTWLVPR